MADAIAYRPGLVSYIDLLAFRHLVQESRRDPSKVAHILAILERVQKEWKRGGEFYIEEGKGNVFHAFSFSDLTFRCTYLTDQLPLNRNLAWELINLADTQTFLALDGVFIRGGVCSGDIFIQEGSEIVFGPALVKAYELESEYAIYPRIVIDRDLWLGAKKEDSLHPFLPMAITQGDDGTYFLDYFYVSISARHTMTSMKQDPVVLAMAHRQMLLAIIKDNIREKHERVRQKFMWLALYHNSTIRRIVKSDPILGEKRIEDALIPEADLDF